jgi:hypothetical protein
VVTKAISRELALHRLGMGMSMLCLVHCIALPWLLASLPLMILAALPDVLRDNEWLHAALIAPVALVSGPVLLRGKPDLIRIALVGAALALLSGALFVTAEAGEQAMTIAGAALLLVGHWQAMRSRRKPDDGRAAAGCR